MIHFISKQLSINSPFKFVTIEYVKNWLQGKIAVQFDIETQGLNFKRDKVLLYQFGDAVDQFVIDQKDFPLTLFKDILESETILKIGHNLAFEYRFCREHGIYLEHCYDTMLAEKVLFTGFKKKGYGLDAVVERYLHIKVEKTTRTTFIGHALDKPFSDAQILYAAKDVQPLEDVMKLQHTEAARKGVLNCVRLENKAMLALADIEYNGFALNTVEWKKNANKNIAELAQQELILDNELNKLTSEYKGQFSYQKKNGKRVLTNFQMDMFRPDAVPERLTKINWGSPKQKLKIFKDQLGITPEKKGKPTADIKVLAQIKNPHPLIKQLIKYGEKGKEISTYGHSFVTNYVTNLFKDNRVRTSFSQIQDTGRTSSGNADKDNKGKACWFPSPNTQNIPQTYRKFFVAEEGWKLIGCDYTAQEPIVLANKSQDPILIDFYQNGDGDLYSLTASKMYSIIKGEPVEVPSKIEDDPEKLAYYNAHPNKGLRQTGKIMVLKLNYGGAAYTVKDDLGVDEVEAQKFVNAVLEAFPVKTKYQEEIKKFGVKYGYILIDNITGRKSWFPEWEEYKALKAKPNATKREFSRIKKLQGEIERKCCNFPIQGESASMSKLAMVFAREEIKKQGLRDVMKLVNMVHDELIAEVKDEFVEQGARLLEDCMVRAANVFVKSIQIKARPSITQYWSK